MKTTIRTLLVSAGAAASTAVVAHPGHDHSALSSGFIHALFYGAIAAVAGLAVYLALRHIRGKKQSRNNRNDSQ